MRERAGRIRSLDGLRGLAALVVLLHHSLLVIPAVAANSRSVTWLIHSPLHLFWAGNEAVYVFFVLSGLVLTLPALRHRSVRWPSYYPSRLLRLYLPVAASVAIAMLLAALVPRTGMHGRSVWMQSHDQTLSVASVVRDATLASPDWLNSPLWSLRWEVLFSVLLPVYLLVTKVVRRRWLSLAVCSLAMASVGAAAGSAPATYLPMFLLGCAIALGVHDGSIDLRSTTWRWVTLGSAVGITASWWTDTILTPTAAFPIVLASAGGLVVSATGWSSARVVLESRFLQFLGTISFSLYLIHEPVVVTAALLLSPRQAEMVPVVAIPIALLVAWVFYRWVESPSHRLAKRAAAFVDRRFGVRSVEELR